MSQPSPSLRSDLDRVAAAFPLWDELAGARVLVTGASGLIGSYLAELLQHPAARDRGIVPVLAGRSLCRLRERFGAGPELLEYREATELTTAVQRSRVVIHAAGTATPAGIAADPVGTMETHLAQLGQLLSAAVTGTRVVVVSSAEVYGQVPGATALREHDLGWLDLLAARSSYPVAKRAAETLLASHAAQYGVDGVVVRPGYVYGPTMRPDDDRVVPQFVRAGLAGGPIVLSGDGTSVRSYVYVADCVTGILTAALRGAPTTAYNIADPDGVVSIRELAGLVGGLTGAAVTFANPDHAGAPAPGRPVSRVVLDPGALLGLGWRPTTSLPEGLAVTAAAAAASR